MPRRRRLSASDARRIALAAQGFDRERPQNASDIRHFRRVMSSINVLQLDFVNVLMPAHFLMPFSRLGAYDRQRFEHHLYESGEYIEQWAHEASIVSSSDWPLLAHRRAQFRPWKNSPLTKMKGRVAYLNNILKHVEERGHTTSNDLPHVKGPKRKVGDWYRSVPRWAIEHHFGTGKLAVQRRQKNFQRVYDLPHRVLGSEICEQAFDKDESERRLVAKAVRSLGVATLHDIADYYRMTVKDTEPRLRELLAGGSVSEVEVECWKEPAFLCGEARLPRHIGGASLLSPFDPMVWFRPRAERLFDFEYRIEIYVPAAKRRWGYYVLPFRQGELITARVDLKADRKNSTLLVQHAHLEQGADRDSTATELALELQHLAAWQRLDAIEVKKANAFEKTLARFM